MEVADRRALVGELGRVLAAQRGDEPGDDHGQPVGPGVDHARLAQDRELLGAALDRLLARLERALQHVGQQHVLLVRRPRRRTSRWRSMWARSCATRCAIARTADSIVPSAGLRTDS